MKKTLILVCLSLVYQIVVAQPKEVKLVVTGEGQTKEEATDNALRSAVEQAFGVFVSANTEILNDAILKDEVATISSGNIKSYVENAYLERPDGVKSITLTVIVSISQLISYTNNHGYSTEFAGSTFGANMRLYELNRNATKKALWSFYRELLGQVGLMYDYKLKVSDPVIEGENGVVQLTVDVLANENTKAIGEYYFNAIIAMGNTYEEVKPLVEMGNDFYSYGLFIFNKNEVWPPDKFKSFETEDVYRNIVYFSFPLNAAILNHIFLSAETGFEIKDNLGNTYTFKTPSAWCSLERTRNSVYDKATFNSLQTGVYKSRRGEALNAVESLDVVARNTDYEPGEIVYQLQHEVKIDKHTLFSISSFDIKPDIQGGIGSVISYLFGEAYDSAVSQYTRTSRASGYNWKDVFWAALSISDLSTPGVYIGQYIDPGFVFWISKDRKKAKIVAPLRGEWDWNSMQLLSGELEMFRLPNKEEAKMICGSSAVLGASLRFTEDLVSGDSSYRRIECPISGMWTSDVHPDDPERAGYYPTDEGSSFKYYNKNEVKSCVIVREIDLQDEVGAKSISTSTNQPSNSRFEETENNLTQTEDGIVGYWRGEDGSMIYIPSEKTKDSEGRTGYHGFFFYKENNYCEYCFVYESGRDEEGNLAYDMDNGHEGGTLFLNESKQILIAGLTFHKDTSIAALLEQKKAGFDSKNKTEQGRAVNKIAENPWVLGNWGMGRNVVVVIKNNGVAIVYGTEVVIRMGEDGMGYFEEGGEVYTIDWVNKTIIFMENEPLQKLDK